MEPAEMQELIRTVGEQVKVVVRELADRELMLALAADTDMIYQLDREAVPIMAAGNAIQGRLSSIREIGRQLDILNDPAALTEVS